MGLWYMLPLFAPQVSGTRRLDERIELFMPARSSAKPTAAQTANEFPEFSHRNLPLLLLMSREAMMAHFRPILSHHGLTEQQWRIIRTLSECGEMEQRLLCESCQILGPSLAGILTRMEETDLVVRHKVPSDQRRVVVSLSAHAQDLVQRICPLIDAQYVLLEEALGRDFLEGLYRQLDQLLAFQDRPIRHVALPPFDGPGKGRAKGTGA